MKTSEKITRTVLLISFLVLTSASTGGSELTGYKSNLIGYKSDLIGYKNQPQGYVTVCHGGHNLRVNTSAVEYHLRHGDKMGGCLADPT